MAPRCAARMASCAPAGADLQQPGARRRRRRSRGRRRSCAAAPARRSRSRRPASCSSNQRRRVAHRRGRGTARTGRWTGRSGARCCCAAPSRVLPLGRGMPRLDDAPQPLQRRRDQACEPARRTAVSRSARSVSSALASRRPCTPRRSRSWGRAPSRAKNASGRRSRGPARPVAGRRRRGSTVGHPDPAAATRDRARWTGCGRRGRRQSARRWRTAGHGVGSIAGQRTARVDELVGHRDCLLWVVVRVGVRRAGAAARAGRRAADQRGDPLRHQRRAGAGRAGRPAVAGAARPRNVAVNGARSVAAQDDGQRDARRRGAGKRIS